MSGQFAASLIAVSVKGIILCSMSSGQVEALENPYSFIFILSRNGIGRHCEFKTKTKFGIVIRVAFQLYSDQNQIVTLLVD